MREFKIPAIVAIILTAVFGWLLCIDRIQIKDFSKLIDVSINIAGILLGFLITLHGILISMRGSRVMTLLKQAGTLPELTNKLKVSISSAALVLIYSLIILILDFESIFIYTHTGDAIQIGWFFLIVILTISSYRFISLFIDIITEEERK